MKAYNCPDCNIAETTTYNPYDLCSSCLRSKSNQSGYTFVIGTFEPEVKSALCGKCGRTLVKSLSPNSLTNIEQWFCPNCNEYPTIINYIYGG